MKKILVSGVLLLLYSCDLIFIENISDANIEALSPVNNTAVLAGQIKFSWEELEDADTYNIQIASPNFTEANEIIADTTLATTSYTRALEEGNYEWRVKGSNSEYETAYTNNLFSVLLNLTAEELTLLLPEDNSELDAGMIDFSWQKQTGADTYYLQIATPDFESTNVFIVDELLTENTFSKELETGTYQWRIKAQNNLSETIYKTHTLKIN